jgi:diacylglycerol kinase family enzyme
MSIDGQDISDGCILWGAMNIPSAGPALHLAPKAKTDDGLLNFVAVRERDRTAFIKHVDAHLAGRKERRSPRPRKFRKLIIHSLAGALHLDGRQWPSANKNNKRLRGAVEITLKPLP